MTEILSVSIPHELRIRIDKVRGLIPRSTFIAHLLETALSTGKGVETSAGKSSEAANQQKDVGDH
jgi:metal-responsive CopG/Arc/MetJ family transcriptional regulator